MRGATPNVYALARRTPLVPLAPLAGGNELPGRIHVKLETLQPIGSFKIRGAANAVAALTDTQLAEGVWTVSAGNAAQGVAFAARRAA
ncbi:MAG: threonine dehydratase, partial [Acidobacteria bacterium]|nr:threonine dehydratase [Acidobacteriota bacterium]